VTECVPIVDDLFPSPLSASQLECLLSGDCQANRFSLRVQLSSELCSDRNQVAFLLYVLLQTSAKYVARQTRHCLSQLTSVRHLHT